MSLRLKGQRTHQGDKSCWILSHCTLCYQDHGDDFLKTHWAKTSRYKFWIWKLLLNKSAHFRALKKKKKKQIQRQAKQREKRETRERKWTRPSAMRVIWRSRLRFTQLLIHPGWKRSLSLYLLCLCICLCVWINVFLFSKS